jgi:hypothetical protein
MRLSLALPIDYRSPPSDYPGATSKLPLAAIARFDDAFWIAMGETNVRFTIPEMDQLLAEA